MVFLKSVRTGPSFSPERCAIWDTFQGGRPSTRTPFGVKGGPGEGESCGIEMAKTHKKPHGTFQGGVPKAWETFPGDTKRWDTFQGSVTNMGHLSGGAPKTWDAFSVKGGSIKKTGQKLKWTKGGLNPIPHISGLKDGPVYRPF